jgi:hypothetical protein
MFGFNKSPRIEKTPLEEISIEDALASASLLTDPDVRYAVERWRYVKADGAGGTPEALDALNAIEVALSGYGIILERPAVPAHLQTASESWEADDWRVYTLDTFASRYQGILDQIQSQSEESAKAA